MKAPAADPVAGKPRCAHLELRIDERQLLIDGAPARLGARAFDVLLALIERRDRVVSKNELLDCVWPGLVVEENNLQVHVSALRKALGPQTITTVPGRGYRFTPPPGQFDAMPEKAPSSDRNAARVIEPATDAATDAANLLPLFGRDDDLDALCALLVRHRLVTIAGPGGIGKTTLARAVARIEPPLIAQDVCLVELAAVNDPSLVTTVLASALDIKLGNQKPLHAIATVLRSNRKLIVLDNCEHLLQSVAELVDALLPLATGVHWLTTSQEPLKVAGEQVFRIGALSLPLDETLEAAASAGALALFEARAQAADPRFALDNDNVKSVVAICRDLDGVPLAIELAAARVPMLGVEGLRRRLGERLRVLTGGARLSLPRHQTMRAALEWSHSLLTPDQQVVFRRLGVFAGSFSLEAAQRVVEDAEIDSWAVLDELGALIDKSLVVVLPVASGEPRYRLLETMRQFALDRLAAAGDGDAVRTRHLAFFVTLADDAKAGLTGPEQVAWMTKLTLEHENLLAAHAWCRHVANGAELDLRLITSLGRYWLNRALFSLGYRLTIEALEYAGRAKRDALRCAALVQASFQASRLELYDEAQALLVESVDIARDIGSNEWLARALNAFGAIYHRKGELSRARAALEEALSVAREIGGDNIMIRAAAIGLGELERTEGRWDAAIQLNEEALGNARRHGDLRGAGTSLINLGMLAILKGDIDSAKAVLVKLFDADEVTSGYQQMFTLLLCAGLAALKEQWGDAARFEAASAVQFARFGWSLDPADRGFAATVRERAQNALGVEAFAAAQASALAETFDETRAEMRQWFENL